MRQLEQISGALAMACCGAGCLLLFGGCIAGDMCTSQVKSGVDSPVGCQASCREVMLPLDCTGAVGDRHWEMLWLRSRSSSSDGRGGANASAPGVPGLMPRPDG